MKILFLCTGNSCRSQMAEGWARRLKAAEFEAFSAGIDIKEMDNRAVEVMAECGVDISKQYPKHVRELIDKLFDYVITVCDHADKHCPTFPGNTKVIHVGFEDPPKSAGEVKSEKEILAIYRRVRDKIKTFVETLPESLKHHQNGS